MFSRVLRGNSGIHIRKALIVFPQYFNSACTRAILAFSTSAKNLNRFFYNLKQ